MKKIPLGSTDIEISEICLGSMTWGEQNTEAQGHEQIDYAMSQGINFIDTAEMYSVPPKPETYGATETIIGNWFAKNPNKRQELVLASKVAGPKVPWVHNGEPINRKNITSSLEGSLKRLQTDYIDLYQLHWANRATYHFGTHWPRQIDWSGMDKEQEKANFLEVLETLDEFVKQGKIREIGLSNETAWGISQYLGIAKEHKLPKVQSVQNEFNLLHWVDSPAVLETCQLEKVTYLAWSPLGGGVLSGKYRNGARPENSRWTIPQRMGIFRDTVQSEQAVEALHTVATKQGITLTELSLAWMYQHPAMGCSIIGATSLVHLKENIGAYSITLSEEILEDINLVIRQYPIPF